MRFKYCLVFLAAALTLRAQVGTEAAASPRLTAPYPDEWPPGPPRSSVPEWAKPGRFSFARWDGGPAETAKAFLSGWPGFNPPVPESVYAMTNWYDPRTIRLLREGGVKLIWVTHSNGFSIPTERKQRELLRRYIDECHRQGIKVMAYQSIANMFWEDMYEQVPESKDWVSIGKDGQPVRYGAGDYSKMGRVTRYMANLSHPGWRDYLKKRIDLAIDDGVDGIIYDNNFSAYLFDTYRDLYQYASSRKRDLLLMANFHSDTYAFNRLINAITTEDGLEPGVYSEASVRRMRGLGPKYALPVDGGYLINNVGLFRIHNALSEGWKPTMIEDGGREVSERMSAPMSGPRYQLALAEAMMFNIAEELFVEGGFARGLWYGHPESVEVWRAIGQYNRFFGDNEEYYVGGRVVAPVAMVLDDRSAGVPLLDALAARNVLYEVVYERDLTVEKLKPYGAVALLTTGKVRAGAQGALENYASGGGKIVELNSAALPPVDDLAKTLKEAGGPARAAIVGAPNGVLYNVMEQPAQGRLVVHLLNYTLKPTGAFKVVVKGGYGSVKLLTPDSPRAPLRTVSSSPSATEVEVPSLKTYSILVAERPDR